MTVGRPLKNFEDYRDALWAYAKAAGVRIQYERSISSGVYRPRTNAVFINPDLPESTEVATTLHELGHSQDPDLTEADRVDHAALHARCATKEQKTAVVVSELRAWNIARSIAATLNIPLGKWFDAEEKECLEGYANWKPMRYRP